MPRSIDHFASAAGDKPIQTRNDITVIAYDAFTVSQHITFAKRYEEWPSQKSANIFFMTAVATKSCLLALGIIVGVLILMTWIGDRFLDWCPTYFVIIACSPYIPPPYWLDWPFLLPVVYIVLAIVGIVLWYVTKSIFIRSTGKFLTAFSIVMVLWFEYIS